MGVDRYSETKVLTWVLLSKLLFERELFTQMSRLWSQKNWFTWISWSKQWKHLLVYGVIFPEQRLFGKKLRSSQFSVLTAMSWYRWSPFSWRLGQAGILPNCNKSNKPSFVSSVHYFSGLWLTVNESCIFNSGKHTMISRSSLNCLIFNRGSTNNCWKKRHLMT